MEKYKEQKWSGAKGKKFGHAGRVNEPYELAAGQEAAVCEDCHALYQGKRWFFDEKLYGKLAGAGKVRQVVCPTCRKIKDHYVEGYLTLSGEFLVEHKDETRHAPGKGSRPGGEAQRATTASSRWCRKERKLVVETTTEKLAQHLGRAVYKAYKGELSFQWGDPNRFVRVYWSR